MDRKFLNKQSGGVLTTFAVLLVVLLGFIALGTEAGTWYLVRSELSKSVDAAALAGAKNISNPYLDVASFAEEVGYENFSLGQLGTPGSGEGAAAFTATIEGSDKVRVLGRVYARSFLARLFGIEHVTTRSSGVAQKKEVEIMMVLDKSGSMTGNPIADLKEAALSFLSFFEDTQDRDKMGLISFATGMTVDPALSTYFVSDMTTQINAMQAQTGKRQFTNAENAIDSSDNEGDGGFTDQSGIPGDLRLQQFLVFFTDGNPNAFRDIFRYQGSNYDAVAYTEGQWGSCTGNICGSDHYLCHPLTGDSINMPALPTGDGRRTGSVCAGGYTTRWQVFLEYPVPGFGPESCRIPVNRLRPTWFQNVARQKAIHHAQELKDKNIKIYTIGLGDDDQINRTFLSQIATGPAFEYYAPNSAELQAIFNAVAKDIKLRLVE